MSCSTCWVLCWWMKSARAGGTSKSSGRSWGRSRLSLERARDPNSGKNTITKDVDTFMSYLLMEVNWLPLKQGRCFPFPLCLFFVRQSLLYLPWGRGFWALGLMKILGRNGVLELSIFSRNLSWGRMMFFAWSSRKVSDFVFLLYSPAYDQWIQILYNIATLWIRKINSNLCRLRRQEHSKSHSFKNVHVGDWGMQSREDGIIRLCLLRRMS